MKNVSKTKAQLLEELSGLRSRVAELEKRHDKGTVKKVSPAIARVDRTGLVDKKKATVGPVRGNKYPPSGKSKVQEAIQETEAQFRVALEDGTVPMATLNPDLQLAKVNRAFCNLLGYTKQELKGRIFKDIIHPDDVEQTVDLTTRVFSSGLPSFQFENRFLTKSQTIIWCNVAATVVRDREGNPTYIFVTIENITERKRAENTLRAIVEGTAAVSSADFFHSLLRHLTVALDAPYAFIAECVDATNTRARTLVFLKGDTFIENVEYALEGTPCEEVFAGKICFHPEDVQHLFPQDTFLVELDVQCYLGLPLQDSSGKVIGLLVVMSQQPVTFDTQMESPLRIFAARAGAELERKQAEEALRESEEHLRFVADNSPVGIAHCDQEQRYKFVNRHFAEMFGLQAPDIVGLSPRELLGEDAYAYARPYLEAVLAGQHLEYDLVLLATRHGQRTVHVSYAPECDTSGQVVGFLASIIDITKRKQEEALKFGQQHILELISHSNTSLPDILDAIIHFTENQFPGVRATILNLNDNTLQHGAAPSMSATYIEQINGLEIGPNVGSCGTAAYRKERVIVADVATDPLWADYHQLGAEFGFRACWSEPIFDSSGKVLGTFALYREEPGVPTDTEIQLIENMASVASIAIERKQAESELRDFEIRNRTLLEGSSTVCNKVIDLDSRLQYMSAAGLKQLKIPDIRPLYGCTYPPDFYSEAMRAPIIEHLERAKAGEISSVECPVLDMEGNEIWYHTTFVPAHDDEGRIKYILATSVDITERKKGEEALKGSEERYAMVMGAVNDGLWDWDIITNQVYLSSTWKKILGFEEHELQNHYEEWANRIHLEDYDQVMDSVKNHLDWNHPYEVEHRLRHKDGTYRWILTRGACARDEQGRPHRMFGSITDITQRKLAEEKVRNTELQLRNSQKLNALGTLAEGIAHDFNNILAAIIGFTELTFSTGPHEEKVQRYLTEVLTAGSRAKELVKQILTFSRQTEGQKKPLHCQQVVQEVLMLIRATLPSTIKIQVQLSATSDLVQADATQIHQVLMNLCTNAEYAMREQGGVLSVRLENVEEVAAEGPASHMEHLPGTHLLLTVQDTGYGMPPEVLDRIFDPFFTTKKPGEGTGMGLAVVHGIIADHHGRITVTSTPGEGTTVSIVFPLLAAAAVADIATDTIETDAELPSSAPFQSRLGHVLLVDDEAPLVALGKELLEAFGYEVTARTSSLEALEAFRAAPNRYDLLITDQTMPNLSGEALAREILRIRPDLPILLCTGFSHTMTEEKARELGIRKFLMKPLLRRDLVLALKEVMGEVDTKD